MTTLKVNVIKKPTIKIKVLPNFPSSVTVTSPLLLSRIGGNYAFSFDAVAFGSFQPLDADLSALAANSTDGLWAHTGAGTGAARTLTAPAAGITITNPAGIAGNPTLVLANDLAAVEGLASTGIARRTGTDTWSVGTAVSNAELATMAAFTFKANNTSGAAVPTDVDIAALTSKASPAASDLLMISDQAASGAWKKVLFSAFGAVASYNARTGAVVPVLGDYTYSGNTVAYPPRFWNGYQHSNNVGTPNTKIDIAAGSSRDSTDAINITNSSGTIDCTVIAAINGLDAGALGQATTVTISNATPAVISWASHGFAAGQPVSFATSGALPTGLTSGTTYFVIPAGLVTNAFEVSATLGGAAINTSSAGSGVHTGTAALDYYTFAISTAAFITAYLASRSPTAPTLPATYTKFRRVGFFRTNAQGQINPFKHVNNQWWWNTTAVPRDVSGAPTINTNTVGTLSVPKVLGVVAKVSAVAFPGTAVAGTLYVFPTWIPITAALGGGVTTYATTNGNQTLIDIQVDANAQINYFVGTASGTHTVVLDTLGWRDDL